MYGILVYALLATQIQPAAAADRDSASPVSLDGNWTVLCFEKDGMPDTDAKNMTVTVANNVISCYCPAKKETKMMRLEFGPDATLRVTDISSTGSAEKSKTGVYVLAKESLAICIHHSADAAAGVAAHGEGTPKKMQEAFTAMPQTKSHCTIMLKRTAMK